jgi:prefoldin subunit 5
MEVYTKKEYNEMKQSLEKKIQLLTKKVDSLNKRIEKLKTKKSTSSVTE